MEQVWAHSTFWNGHSDGPGVKMGNLFGFDWLVWMVRWESDEMFAKGLEVRRCSWIRFEDECNTVWVWTMVSVKFYWNFYERSKDWEQILKQIRVRDILTFGSPYKINRFPIRIKKYFSMTFSKVLLSLNLWFGGMLILNLLKTRIAIVKWIYEIVMSSVFVLCEPKKSGSNVSSKFLLV